jgi:rhodanese-related sulfurtransferase
MTMIPPTVTPDDVSLYLPSAQLLDCRSAGEFAAGHVAGARNIPLEELPSVTGTLDPARPVILVCASGRRASIAAEQLAGRFPVAVLAGGLQAWTRSGRNLTVSSRRWSIERQVRLFAGAAVSIGALGVAVDPRWAILPAAVGGGLAIAALTNSCALGSALMRMPWNRRAL